MDRKKFTDVAGTTKQDNYKRETPLYSRSEDIRGEFERDYNRILHCNAYRRLKHKTQVFFATDNDHVCTRIEHVNHVAAVSYTIAKHLGLNTDLTKAIAIGHDLGHAPFGHEGERILSEILNNKLKEKFWHEKNSLIFADYLETLTDPKGKEVNLNLTYAVRDGIISHCGEVKAEPIFPREEYIDLHKIQSPNQYSPFTWEGCIVKVADKIAYLGRDIEDGLTLGVLKYSQLRELKKSLKNIIDVSIREINNTVLMHSFIVDLCDSSSPKTGICFSEKYFKLIELVKNFNYENIYRHTRLNHFKKYASLVINSIFEALMDFYDGRNTLAKIGENRCLFPQITDTFSRWLIKYSNIDTEEKRRIRCENVSIFDIDNYSDYVRLAVEYISGMTDNYAIKLHKELISFS